jgi:hypothetical protein
MIGPAGWAHSGAQQSAVFRAKEQRNPFPPVEETPTAMAYFRPKRQHFEGGFGHRQARTFGVPLTDDPDRAPTKLTRAGFAGGIRLWIEALKSRAIRRIGCRDPVRIN